jgi:hypothetical protein
MGKRKIDLSMRQGAALSRASEAHRGAGSLGCCDWVRRSVLQRVGAGPDFLFDSALGLSLAPLQGATLCFVKPGSPFFCGKADCR